MDENTTLGVIGTFRHGADYANDVVGVDGRWQKGAHTVTAQVLRSESEYPITLEFDDATPSGSALSAGYSFGNRAWDFTVSQTEIDLGFRADLGFMGQVGFDRTLVAGGHNWYGEEGEAITRINLYGDWDITHRYDGQLLEREFEGRVNVQGPMQSSMSLGGLTRVRFWDEQMFDENYVYLDGVFTPMSGIRLGAYINSGQRVDLRESALGRQLDVEFWGELDLGRGVNITPNFSWSRLRRDGGTAYTALVFDTRVSWQLDPRQRLRLTLQGSDIERDLSLYSDEDLSQGGRDWAASCCTRTRSIRAPRSTVAFPTARSATTTS